MSSSRRRVPRSCPVACAPRPCPVAVRTARPPLRQGAMLGRRVSRLAPPRRIARGGSPLRCAAWQVAHAGSFAGASPCAPHSRAGRGVQSPHPRHSRGPSPTPPAPRHYTRTLPVRRDGDIAPYRYYTRVVRPRRAHPRALPPLARAPSPSPVAARHSPAVAHRRHAPCGQTTTDMGYFEPTLSEPPYVASTFRL